VRIPLRFSALTACSSLCSLLPSRPSFKTSRKLAYSALFPAVFASVALALLPAQAQADSIVLKNGDHLTGAVTQLAGGKLTVHTDYAGDVTITFDQVSSVKLDKPIVLSLDVPPPPGKKKSSKRLDIRKEEITSIDRSGANFTVTTAAGTENIPAAGLTTVRTAAAQQAYEASLHPGWLHDWTAIANVSFALARGNSDTTTLGTGVTLVRPTPTDKTSLYFNDIYTHDGLADLTTADHTNAGARYDHNVNPKLFAFGTIDFATDALQYLDLRSVAGGGLGWHAIAKPKQQLDLLGGLVWTHENYGAIPEIDTTIPITPAVTAEINSFAALDFGEQYTRQLGASSSFTEQAYIFPDLGDTSQYRTTLNAGLSTKIKSFLSWQTTVSDVYVTNPPSGTKDNDFILTTGLGFTFIRK
jgi:putative salt-induced outer membrane protein